MKLSLIIYLLPIFLLLGWYAPRKRRQEADSMVALDANIQAGLNEPASIHPVIDPLKCIGFGACVSACPEGDVLGVIDSKAHLVNATHFIGHGACQQACPFDAITLVFGTEKRGMDIPFVQAKF